MTDPDELLRQRGIVVDWGAIKAQVGYDPERYALVERGVEDDIQNGHRRSADTFIDWRSFWEADHNEAEWVYPEVLARGRGHALYATHKLGKSLFMLWIAAQLATGEEPIVVVYLDYEMTEADIHDRLDDMGYGPASDLSRLRYALLPSLPPLDKETGSAALCEILDSVALQFPDHHIVVIIDTISRAVAGEENDADTFRNFYNHTGIELKRRGITWARLDHSGKDPGKGQRGSSSKGDDVDLVWVLTKTNEGVRIDRDFCRMSWCPPSATFGLLEEPLHYHRLTNDWPEHTGETANLLERLNVPLEASTREASARLRAVGEGRRRQLIVAAMRFRHVMADERGTTFRNRAEPQNDGSRNQDDFPF